MFRPTAIRQVAQVLIPLALYSVGWIVPCKAQAPVSVKSPDGALEAHVNAGAALTYTVQFHGTDVIRDSRLGLEYRGLPILGPNLKITSTVRRASDSTWKTVCGKFSTVRNQYNEAAIHLASSDVALPQLILTFRAYNDGIAFRYSVSDSKSNRLFTLTRELTEYRFARDARAWAANKEPAYETEYSPRQLSSIGASNLISLPLLVRVQPDLYSAITEADLTDWSGAYVSGESSGILYRSPLIVGNEPPRKITVPVKGIRLLELSIGDGGDGFEFDHADWADATLISADGKRTRLSTLTPVSASQGFGKLSIDKSVGGNPISIAGIPFNTGLGTHSVGSLVFDLGAKYEKFESSIGIDSETKGKGSVVFSVIRSPEPSKTAQPVTLTTRLAPRIDGEGLVKRSGPHSSPWRIVMLGNRPGALVESELVENLSPPCAIPDTSWIRPGMMAWDHWWSGDVKMDTATDERFIQLAADMHWPYQLVDWQWYGQFDTASADITHTNPAVNMPELLQYAKDRHVRLWVWLHSNDVNRFLVKGKLGEAFATYEQWGLAGVKIDFMNRDDQEMVNWYEKVVQIAAAHHLMIDFHGAYKPTGLRRTYPNLLTREGVLGNEYNKFSNRVTPEHTVTLPFTRMLAGPMDFTPGGFLNVTKAEFKQTKPTTVMGTRAHQLAMFVVYDSPLCCVCDDPDNYKNQAGVEFLKIVPTTWDETRVLAGEPGEFIVSARRSGSNWFLGGMAGQAARTVDVPLSFLGSGTYEVLIFQDAKDADRAPTHLSESRQIVKATNKLHLVMSREGGFAIRLSKSSAAH